MLEAAAAAPAAPGATGGGGTHAEAESTPPLRAMSRAVGAGVAAAVPLEAPAGPVLNSFRDVAALVKDHREAMLHAHLLHSAHLVRFAPPVIELRTETDAPRDLAPKLAALLSNATGARWTIALSTAAGEPTLADQSNGRRRDAPYEGGRRPSTDPARSWRRSRERASTQVHDSRCRRLRTTRCASDRCRLGELEMPEFAPPDAEFTCDSDFSDDTPWESEP